MNNVRKYFFKDGTIVGVCDGKYLSPSEIKEKESKHGKITSVRFRNQIVIAR